MPNTLVMLDKQNIKRTVIFNSVDDKNTFLWLVHQNARLRAMLHDTPIPQDMQAMYLWLEKIETQVKDQIIKEELSTEDRESYPTNDWSDVIHVFLAEVQYSINDIKWERCPDNTYVMKSLAVSCSHFESHFN